MSFFKDKKEMFSHRAERMEREVERATKKGNSDKADWARGQVKENREKADKYKNDKGW